MVHKTYLRSYVGSKVVILSGAEWSKNRRQGGGTGFHVVGPSGKTYIMTNRHVCHDSEDGTLWATVENETSDHRVKIIASSNDSDLCILEPIPGIEGLHLGRLPAIGQDIMYVGHPRLQPRTYVVGEVVGTDIVDINQGVIGKDITEAQCKTKDSYIREIPEIVTLFDMFKRGSTNNSIDIEDNPIFRNTRKVRVCFERGKALVSTLIIYPGASGSPIVNAGGDVIGVVYAGPSSGGWGYGIILPDVQSILNGR